MEKMHFFKESQREEIPSPDFKEHVTINLLLESLCDIREWIHSPPYIHTDMAEDTCSLYIVFRDISFSNENFWQTFGGYFIALCSKWEIHIFSSELSTQETVELSLDQKGHTFYAVQKTISGRYADNLCSLCLKINCTCIGEVTTIILLCQNMSWQNRILVTEWNMCKIFEREHISWLHQNTCYCYGYTSDIPEKENYLNALRFPQKVHLWSQFLEKRIDYMEFDWLYDKISCQELDNRTEWELALYSAMNLRHYTLKISESEFELYDDKENRCYFSFNSGQNAQRAFLKLLFPVNI